MGVFAEQRIMPDAETYGFPSFGWAAWVRKNLCGFEEVKYDENVQFFGRMGPQRRTWNAGFLTVLYVNHAVFLR